MASKKTKTQKTIPFDEINKLIDKIIFYSKGYSDEILLETCKVHIEEDFDLNPKKYYGNELYDPVIRRNENPPETDNFTTSLSIKKIRQSYKKNFKQELRDRMIEIVKEGFFDQIKELSYVEGNENIYFDPDEDDDIETFLKSIEIKVEISEKN